MSRGPYAEELARRFREVNGDHPMTAADDTYVSARFTPLEDLCAARGRGVARVRRRMLEGFLPLPGYLRSNGTELVPHDLFDLGDTADGIDGVHGAGGVESAAGGEGPERLRAWFTAHWADPVEGAEEWGACLSGRYVCLPRVTPETIRRKAELTGAITAAVRDPRPDSPLWSVALHALVDELDALVPDFAPYDRLRFGGPTSRDLCVDAVRARFPRPGPAPAGQDGLR
ncbi:DUF6058 family natural product biosynthesis protein [Streptomyces roseoviridis]|uniref:DUF6058 family natural product biosynthesis protein n=1 Tax=Streptomyces roseoviridis TaxID=67361 RepID=UPI0031E7D383